MIRNLGQPLSEFTGPDGECRYCAQPAITPRHNCAEIERLVEEQPPRPRASKWHVAPDGSDCCCTAEERRYGAGCR